jgi:hypothetical protein
MVQVDKGKDEPFTMSPGARSFLAQPGFRRTSVEQPGEFVGQRELFQGAALLAVEKELSHPGRDHFHEGRVGFVETGSQGGMTHQGQYPPIAFTHVHGDGCIGPQPGPDDESVVLVGGMAAEIRDVEGTVRGNTLAQRALHRSVTVPSASRPVGSCA